MIIQINGGRELDTDQIERITVQFFTVKDGKKFLYSGHSFPNRKDPSAHRIYTVYSDGGKFRVEANVDDPGMIEIARLYRDRFQADDDGEDE